MRNASRRQLSVIEADMATILIERMNTEAGAADTNYYQRQAAK